MKKTDFQFNIYIILFLFLYCNIGKAQNLNVPARNTTDQNGSQIISSISNLSLENRESYILAEVLKGNIPDFYRNMVSVTDSAYIISAYKHITYYVIPDYLAVGCDTNYFICPMTPILGQMIADSLDCILPTRKMVDRIWNASRVKMQPQTIPPGPQMITVPVFSQHDSIVKVQRQNFITANPLGELVSGNKKDVVISNLIYTTPYPKRVVIYGWHYPSGTNIQPLYAGHINTYADYSHGIRLIQNEVYVDGDTMLATDVLTSLYLNSLLSDEGVISMPYYPDTASSVSIPAVPKSFCVLNQSDTSVRIIISSDNNIDNYNVYISSDGINFGNAQTFASNDFEYTGLLENEITYFKISSSNSLGNSVPSEVLAAVPSAAPHNVIIVNGFDRALTSNTFDYIRQHGEAIMNYNYPFSSATNDAVTEGLIYLNHYAIADYILGEESTIDETFSTTEQSVIESYLNNGGYLLVSGSEIGWDLEYYGTPNDKFFYNNYLKAEYVFDAPNNQSSTFYEFQETNNPVFSGLGNTTFDDGTNGTYDVNYPDVIQGINGGLNGLQYSNLSNNFAGVYFKGLFPAAIDTGKLVNLAIPFETVYPESKRFILMQQILDFFADTSTVILPLELVEFNTIKIYPNPVLDKLTIDFVRNSYKNAQVKILDMSGRAIYSQFTDQQKTLINISNLDAGVYLMNVIHQEGYNTFKIIKN